MAKPFISILSVLLLLGLFLAGSAAAVETGSTAPDFKLKTLEGEKVRLSDYRGQVIVLKLATTWCPTCKEQTAEIGKAGEFLAENEVAVVEVFLQDSESMVREFLAEEHYPMPFVALLDDGSALEAYNVYLIPRLVLIDQDFIVRRDGSVMPAEDLIREIEKLVAKKDS